MRQHSTTRSFLIGAITRILKTREPYGPMIAPTKSGSRYIEEFEAPPMEEAIREELEAFVAKRKEEGGAPTDF